MKLNYRGNSYEVSSRTPVDSDFTNQSVVKLIYRGQAYYTTPRPVRVVEAFKPKDTTVTLTYRGNTYKRNLQSPKFYQQPHKINWRYQIN